MSVLYKSITLDFYEHTACIIENKIVGPTVNKKVASQQNKPAIGIMFFIDWSKEN